MHAEFGRIRAECVRLDEFRTGTEIGEVHSLHDVRLFDVRRFQQRGSEAVCVQLRAGGAVAEQQATG